MGIDPGEPQLAETHIFISPPPTTNQIIPHPPTTYHPNAKQGAPERHTPTLYVSAPQHHGGDTQSVEKEEEEDFKHAEQDQSSEKKHFANRTKQVGASPHQATTNTPTEGKYHTEIKWIRWDSPRKKSKAYLSLT